MEDEIQEIYGVLPFSLNYFIEQHIIRKKRDGSYRRNPDRRDIISMRIWQMIEAALNLNLAVALGACAAIGQHRLLCDFLTGIDNNKKLGFTLPSRNKKTPGSPEAPPNIKPLRLATLGHACDLMRLLANGLQNTDNSKMRNFLDDVAKGFGKASVNEGILRYGIGDDLGYLTQNRNDWTHNAHETTVDHCAMWIKYHDWALRERLGFWKWHVLLVRDGHLAWIQRRRNPSDNNMPMTILIPPGHPLEGFEELQAILWTPPRQQIDTERDICRIFLYGMGEYTSLFPFLLATKRPDLQDAVTLAYVRSVNPDQKANHITLEGDIYWPRDEDRGGDRLPFHEMPDRYRDDKDLASSAHGFHRSLKLKEVKDDEVGEWVDKHYRRVDSPVRSLYTFYQSERSIHHGVKDTLEELKKSKGEGTFSSNDEMGIKSDRGIDLLFEGRRRNALRQSSNLLLETSMRAGYEELMRTLSGDAVVKPPRKKSGFVTKICINDDIRIRAWFLEESKKTRELAGHPYIVAALEEGLILDDHEQYPFYLMEKAEYNLAESRQDKISKLTFTEYRDDLDLRALDPEKRLAWHLWILRSVRAIAGALSFLSKRHLVHRDIKPENILVFPEHCIRLADMGSFGYIDDSGLSQAVSEFWPTTTLYRPPEYDTGTPPITDRDKGDIFSFGVLFFVLLAGKTRAENALQSNTKKTQKRFFGLDEESLDYLESIDHSFSLSCDKEPSFSYLIKQCTKATSADRPDSGSLLISLNLLESRIQEYVQEKICQRISGMRRERIRSKELFEGLYSLLFEHVNPTFLCIRKEQKLLEEGQLRITGDEEEKVPCIFDELEGEHIWEKLEGKEGTLSSGDELARLLQKVIRSCPGLLYACSIHNPLRNAILTRLQGHLLEGVPDWKTDSADDPITTCLTLLCRPQEEEV